VESPLPSLPAQSHLGSEKNHSSLLCFRVEESLVLHTTPPLCSGSACRATEKRASVSEKRDEATGGIFPFATAEIAYPPTARQNGTEKTGCSSTLRRPSLPLHSTKLVPANQAKVNQAPLFFGVSSQKPAGKCRLLLRRRRRRLTF